MNFLLFVILCNKIQIMNQQYVFPHQTNKSQFTIKLVIDAQIEIKLQEKYGLISWKGNFTQQNIGDITQKTGHQLKLPQFGDILVKAISQRDISCYVDILTSQDLQNMRNKKNHTTNPNSKSSSKSNKRYLILTYMVNENRYHYPLSLNPIELDLNTEELKAIYDGLRVDLEAARAVALNQTSKTEQSNSFSINYDKKGHKNSMNSQRVKEVDQLRSQNQILKGKLARLQEQVEKKKGNIQIERAIERTKQLKQKLQTANLQLVDWKNNIQEQEDNLSDLKKEMLRLHKKICGLLTTEKQLVAKKKGEEVEKQLNNTKNIMKKNTAEIQKLKKQLETTKNRLKQLQIKAKKLNSEKEVIKKGKRGPYSSGGGGSVRSFGSYSSKRSNGGTSISSKPRSNYSYNSFKNK